MSTIVVYVLLEVGGFVDRDHRVVVQGSAVVRGELVGQVDVVGYLAIVVIRIALNDMIKAGRESGHGCWGCEN